MLREGCLSYYLCWSWPWLMGNKHYKGEFVCVLEKA